MEYFGKLPDFNFTRVQNVSPGSPVGRRRYSSGEDQPRPRKRTVRSESESPSRPIPTKPRIEDISHDDA